MSDVRIQGWDLGLNHLGAVELVNGGLGRFWYVTDKAGGAARKALNGIRLKLPKTKDRQVTQMARLSFMSGVLGWLLRGDRRPDYLGIEDYALDAGHGAHFKGELGGAARLQAWRSRIPIRLHDPMSVKLFATGRGDGPKNAVEGAVLDRWGADFSDCNPGGKSKDRRTSEDLADAFAVAQLVWTEYQLRHGLIALSDLAEHEIRVFNRMTKTYPVNLLDREWIVRPSSGRSR